MMNRSSSPWGLSEAGEDDDDAVPGQPSALNVSSEMDSFEEILGPLSPVGDAHLSLRTTATSGAVGVGEEGESSGEFEKGSSSGTKSDAMGLEDPRSCPSQKRRDKIKAKLKTLQELIPNCHKIMSGVALCQAPFTSPATLQCLRPRQFSPFSPSEPYNAMSLGFGMGMTSTACSIRPFVLPPLPATSLLPMPTLNPIPHYRSPLRMHYMPFASSPEFPASVATQATRNQSLQAESFISINQAETGCQEMQSVIADSLQNPAITEV